MMNSTLNRYFSMELFNENINVFIFHLISVEDEPYSEVAPAAAGFEMADVDVKKEGKKEKSRIQFKMFGGRLR